MRSRTFRALLASFVLAATLGACGGDDENSDARSGNAETAGDAKTDRRPDPRAAIQDYFTAQRLGQAKKICGFEDNAYQATKYDTAGKACLDDEGNNRPQAVWADPVKIVSLKKTSADGVVATIEPNAGTPHRAQIALTLADGKWKVIAFR